MGRWAVGIVVVALAGLPSLAGAAPRPSPTGPPAGAGHAWPDGLGPDTFHAATVGAASIAAGRSHSCAITSLGAVYCWGDNNHGQLGDGHKPTDAATAVPVSPAGGLTGTAVQVDAGDAHTCALDYYGQAFCWGDNGSGQLGVGGTTDAAVPTFVAGLTGRTLVEITTGADHSCALDDQGAAWCWGANAHGQLGVPALPGGATTPVRVSTSTGMTGPLVDIAAGGDTTCAETSAGAAWCWGDNGHGQLGDGTTADRILPGPVPLTGVRQIAAGGHPTCSVDAAGDVSCWGSGNTAPAAVAAGGVRFAQVAAGDRHVCGLARDGTAYCWGSDTYGQLGDGGTTDRPAPAAVRGGIAFADLDAGDRHGCGLDARGAAYCWGADDQGQLGNGTGGASLVPVRVSGLPRPPAAVTGLTVAPIDGGLRVRWHPARDFGSGRFVSYLAVTANFESTCEVRVATGTGCDLLGLTGGSTYDVAVLTYATEGSALSAFGTATARAARPAGGSGGGLPITGPRPALLVAIGSLMVGLGLSALLVPKASRPAPRHGIGRRPA